MPGVALHLCAFQSEQSSGNYLFYTCCKPHTPQCRKQLGSSLSNVYFCLLKSCIILREKTCASRTQSRITWMISSAPSWESQGWHPATDFRGGTRGLHMIHTANSLLSNSLCTFPVWQSVNHYAPPFLPSPHRMWVCVSSQLDSLPL